MEKPKTRKETKDLCKQISEWQKNPDFMRAVREFIRLTTS